MKVRVTYIIDYTKCDSYYKGKCENKCNLFADKVNICCYKCEHFTTCNEYCQPKYNLQGKYTKSIEYIKSK